MIFKGHFHSRRVATNKLLQKQFNDTRNLKNNVESKRDIKQYKMS